MKKALIAVLAAGLGLAATTSANAREVTVTVDLDGINMNDPAAYEIAYQRIERAASRACVAPVGSFINTRAARADCRSEATAKAVSELERRGMVARADSARTQS